VYNTVPSLSVIQRMSVDPLAVGVMPNLSFLLLCEEKIPFTRVFLLSYVWV
jgi:hypothetical protein